MEDKMKRLQNYARRDYIQSGDEELLRNASLTGLVNCGVQRASLTDLGLWATNASYRTIIYSKIQRAMGRIKCSHLRGLSDLEMDKLFSEAD